MGLQFDANQDYQLEAARATVNLFGGQPGASRHAIGIMDEGVSSHDLTETGNGDHVKLDLLRPIEDLKIERGKRHFRNFEEVRFV
jgi:hypothetical protein